MMTIRPVCLPEDRKQLLALDRSFTTDHVYRIVPMSLSFALEAVPVDPPVRKEFPLEDDLGEVHAWEHGLVAERDGTIVGFAALTHRRWNRRTELWHLYVAAALRGQGIGRALVEAVVVSAQEAGTRCVWLETSTLAYPAIQFYRRMGFELCGLDVSLYDPATIATGETALYFSKSLNETDEPQPTARRRSQFPTS